MVKTKVLNKGYVGLVKAWGDESEIIESARMSTGGKFNGWDKDAGLLKFLYDHNHATPFEFVGMTLEVKAPILVFREWHRHRVMSYNEMSGRYIPLPNDNFIPTKERVWEGIEKAGANKQAGAATDTPLTDDALDRWLDLVTQSYDMSQRAYEWGLQAGVPKELARITVPVSRYSVMRVNTSLRNWLGFLALRDAPDAQEEIKVYAKEVAKLLYQHFPQTINLYNLAKRA